MSQFGDESPTVGGTRVGIIGAGRVGSTIARLALRAGYVVSIAGPGTLEEVALAARFTIPGASVASAAEVAAISDLVVVAVPLKKFTVLPEAIFDDRIVIDVMNYWAPLDGYVPGFDDPASTTETVQARLVRSRVVRTLNHIGYHELEADSRPHGDPERRAVAVAGNDAAAVALVADFIDSIGFDPVVTGELATASAFAPDTPIFDGWYNAGDMRDAVTNFTLRAPQEAPSWS